MVEFVSPLLKLAFFLLERLEKEYRLASNAEKDLASLKDSIGAIERFLKKTNSMKVIPEDVKASVKRARKLLYVSEDAINDFTRRTSKIRWEGLIPHIYRLYTRRTFASEAGDINSMALDYITMEKTAIMETLGGLSGNYAQSSSASHLSSSIAYSKEIDEALGAIEKPKDKLVQWLIQQTPKSKVIFVHGTRGVGKTSLVGAVLRNKEVKGFFNYYVWVEDSRSCEMGNYSAAALLKADAKMWSFTTCESESPRNCKLEEAISFMESKTCRWILVIDNAKGAGVFMCLWSHLNRTHPSVLVTTRVRSLKSSSINFFMRAQYDSYDFEHVCLTEHQSESLFCQNMPALGFHGPDLKEATARILKECRGLPLDILETCKFMNCRRPSATGSPDGVKWKKLSRRLAEALASNGYDGDPIKSTRAPRMDTLLDVGAFLFYLSIFPLDYPIRCSTMMRLWMAEGFIEQKGSQTVQEKAEETLEKLLDHDQILEKEKTGYGRVKTCCIPHVRHQHFISRSIDEEFTMIVDRQKPVWPENVWHLSFHREMVDKYDDPWVEQLRSLLAFKRVLPTSLEKLLKAKRLRVIDLQRHLTKDEEIRPQASLITFPQEIFKSKYLKYLSLRGTDIQNIPRKIKKLTFLETLDIRDTLVPKLPKGILELKALRHLLVSRSNRKLDKKKQNKPDIFRVGKSPEGSPIWLAADTDRELGVKVPLKLGDLTLLQKLCMIALPDESKECSDREQLLEELGKLTNLQRLGLSMLKSIDVELLCYSIEKLTNLESLCLIAAEGEKMNLWRDRKRKAPEYLQRVHLIGQLEILPMWILPRASLVKLVLRKSQLTLQQSDPLQLLGEFPCLKHMELEQAFDVSNMTFRAGWFQQLCFLGLNKFDKLESIDVEPGALSALGRLSLAQCRSLTTVPQIIITPPTEMICLELWGMPRALENAVKENEAVRKRLEIKIKVFIEGARETAISFPVPREGTIPPPP